MAELSIRLSSFSDFTLVNVEGLGIIKVKKESSNQGARIQEIMRDTFKLQDEGKTLDKQIKRLIDDGKSSDDPELIKLEKKGTEILDKVSNLRNESMKIRRMRLSDDEDGKLVNILFDSASDEDIAKLLALEVDNTSNEEVKDGTS